MHSTIHLSTAGMGIVLSSPWATRHIEPGSDFLGAHFESSDDVARWVNTSTIAAVCTGSPGDWRLHCHTGPLDMAALEQAHYRVRLGLAVRDGIVQVRDLFALMSWAPECPAEQSLALPDGFYRITAYTSAPESGVLGDDQDIHLHFEATPEPAALAHQGVPLLCD